MKYVATLVAVALMALVAGASAQSRGVVSSNAGRFQVVNGTPEFAKHIMLLDTQTGNTWIVCGGEGGPTNWCAMSRDFEQKADPLAGKKYEPGELRRLPN